MQIVLNHLQMVKNVVLITHKITYDTAILFCAIWWNQAAKATDT